MTSKHETILGNARIVLADRVVDVTSFAAAA